MLKSREKFKKLHLSILTVCCIEYCRIIYVDHDFTNFFIMTYQAIIIIKKAKETIHWLYEVTLEFLIFLVIYAMIEKLVVYNFK